MKKAIIPLLICIPFFCSAQSWQYSSTQSQITGSVTRSADLYSTDSVNLKPPYQGGTRAILSVVTFNPTARHPIYHVYISITRGQIYGSAIGLRFDNDRGVFTTFSVVTDDNTDVCIDDGFFAKASKKMISNISEGHRLIVQLPIYDNDAQTFTFNISGLDLAKL